MFQNDETQCLGPPLHPQTIWMTLEYDLDDFEEIEKNHQNSFFFITILCCFPIDFGGFELCRTSKLNFFKMRDDIKNPPREV